MSFACASEPDRVGIDETLRRSTGAPSDEEASEEEEGAWIEIVDAERSEEEAETTERGEGGVITITDRDPSDGQTTEGSYFEIDGVRYVPDAIYCETADGTTIVSAIQNTSLGNAILGINFPGAPTVGAYGLTTGASGGDISVFAWRPTADGPDLRTMREGAIIVDAASPLSYSIANGVITPISAPTPVSSLEAHITCPTP